MRINEGENMKFRLRFEMGFIEEFTDLLRERVMQYFFESEECEFCIGDFGPCREGYAIIVHHDDGCVHSGMV